MPPIPTEYPGVTPPSFTCMLPESEADCAAVKTLAPLVYCVTPPEPVKATV